MAIYYDNRAKHWIRGYPGQKTRDQDTLLAFSSLLSNSTLTVSTVVIVLYPTYVFLINMNRLANCARLANVKVQVFIPMNMIKKVLYGHSQLTSVYQNKI